MAVVVWHITLVLTLNSNSSFCLSYLKVRFIFQVFFLGVRHSPENEYHQKNLYLPTLTIQPSLSRALIVFVINGTMFTRHQINSASLNRVVRLIKHFKTATARILCSIRKMIKRHRIAAIQLEIKTEIIFHPTLYRERKVGCQI